MQGIQGYPLKSAFALGFGGPQCASASTAQQNASGPSAGNPLGQLGGQLGGLFGGKKKQEQAAPAAAPVEVQMANGLVPMMVVSSEMKSFNQNRVDAALFEVPAGFKQQK